MRNDARKHQKSETLTVRLEATTRFALEFVARLRGQTITAAVERAVIEAAEKATIPGQGDAVLGWRDFWSPVEAEREIGVARQPTLFPGYDEIRRLRFAETFHPYFFTDDTLATLKVRNCEVLWPDIDRFIALHDETKARDAGAVPSALAAALSAAGIAPPETAY